MGTSKSLPTPSGGAWTPLKTDITDYLAGGDVAPEQIVAGTVSAAHGFLAGALVQASVAGGRQGRPKTTSVGRSRRPGRVAFAKALSGLSGFGAAVQEHGLDGGLRSLGLDALRGRPASEVIAAIADHLSEGVQGLAGEVLRSALRNSILEAAALAGDPTYENLDTALQGFLASDGLEGLAELFLANLAFDQVWSLIENHVQMKSDTTDQAQSLADAVQSCCRAEARTLIGELKTEGQFGSIDWFGRQGQRYATDIAGRLEAQLLGLGEPQP